MLVKRSQSITTQYYQFGILSKPQMIGYFSPSVLEIVLELRSARRLWNSKLTWLYSLLMYLLVRNSKLQLRAKIAWKCFKNVTMAEERLINGNSLIEDLLGNSIRKQA
jgi:hypothetical protein